jgi:hypothetical protein
LGPPNVRFAGTPCIAKVISRVQREAYKEIECEDTRTKRIHASPRIDMLTGNAGAYDLVCMPAVHDLGSLQGEQTNISFTERK